MCSYGLLQITFQSLRSDNMMHDSAGHYSDQAFFRLKDCLHIPGYQIHKWFFMLNFVRKLSRISGNAEP